MNITCVGKEFAYNAHLNIHDVRLLFANFQVGGPLGSIQSSRLPLPPGVLSLLDPLTEYANIMRWHSTNE